MGAADFKREADHHWSLVCVCVLSLAPSGSPIQRGARGQREDRAEHHSEWKRRGETRTRQQTPGLDVKRACRFGSACRFKKWHCPFQHPGESREQGYRQDTPGKDRDPEASRVGRDAGWQNVGGRWGWRGQAVEKDRATKPTQGVRRTVAEEPGGGRPTQGPPRPEVAAPAQHLGRERCAREDGRGAQGGRREARTFPRENKQMPSARSVCVCV